MPPGAPRSLPDLVRALPFAIVGLTRGAKALEQPVRPKARPILPPICGHY